ncbi:hypothetical protein EAM_2888 [Erwinia amylovora ATCC 49946]|nr:hypothetical protein EAM_2888 [Erwinia amylovora ATCC 49946]
MRLHAPYLALSVSPATRRKGDILVLLFTPLINSRDRRMHASIKSSVAPECGVKLRSLM